MRRTTVSEILGVVLWLLFLVATAYFLNVIEARYFPQAEIFSPDILDSKEGRIDFFETSYTKQLKIN